MAHCAGFIWTLKDLEFETNKVKEVRGYVLAWGINDSQG